MRLATLTITMPLLTACAVEYGLDNNGGPAVVNYDTAAPDSATWDTGESEEEEEPEPEEEVEPEQEEEPEPEEEEEPEQEEEYDPEPEDDCEDTSDLVYVIDKDTERLYTIEPDTQKLTLLGELDCTMWGTPASMAVARDGYAYVRYSDQSVFQVDVETLACTPTTYNDGGFGSFGMGYATDNAETWRDALYVANDNRVAKLDTSTWKVSVLGTLPSQAELTGNSDGELWAFLPLEQPAELVQLDKDTGAELDVLKITSFPNVYGIDTFAFATWGGDFWLFIRESGMGSSTDVYQVTATGKTTVVARDIGINVVGAGVSTCAPTG